MGFNVGDMPPPARGVPSKRAGVAGIKPTVFIIFSMLFQLLEDVAEVDFLRDDCMKIFDLYALLLH